jgi:hypothetical protein
VEEVDYEPRGAGGRNYGWNTMEGSRCYAPASGCDEGGITPPVLEYSHDSGCSITGGYVYRGRAVPAAVGRYFFGDYCSGDVSSLRMQGGAATDVRREPFRLQGLTTFGTDAAGELYLGTQSGRIFKLAR